MRTSRQSTDFDNRSRQELIVRNQRLATELARLQEINRNLRRALNGVMISNLHIQSTKQTSTVDTATQTIEDQSGDTSFTLQSPRPSVIVTKKVSTTQKSKSHRRSSPLHELNFHILEVGSPQPSATEYGYILRPAALTRDSYSPGNKGVTTERRAPTVNENITPNAILLSPCHERVTAALTDRICSPDKLNMSAEDVSFVKSPASTTSVRGQRSTRKPLSYREPSLNTKVRKGHKFFRF
jgi:hypothetical protein